MKGTLELLAALDDLGGRVDEAEYARLLGYPAGHKLPEQTRVLSAEARSWYRQHGRPWAAARRVDIRDLGSEELRVEGESFHSRQLVNRLRGVEATEVIVAVSTAGAEVDQYSASLWSTGRPDEAYFADRFGAAAVEHLATATAVDLRQRIRGLGLAVIPGYSPGYDGWSLTDQGPLFRLLGLAEIDPPGALSILDSGMLQPKNSLLAIFGVTPQAELAEPLWQRSRCSWCSLSPCALRSSNRQAQIDTSSG
jgi:hypothetical protein